MTLQEFFAQVPQEIYEIIARVALFILVIFLIIILRRILKWLILRPLRLLLKRSGAEDETTIVEVIAAPMRYFVIAIALVISVQIIQVSLGVEQLIYGIARSLIIFSLLLFIYNLVDLIAPSSLRIATLTGLEIQERLLPFIRVAIKSFILAVGVVVLLQEWGYDVSGLLAGIGIGGLALSLAAQDTIANLFGFVAIVSDRPFDVGEFIKTNNIEGIVEHVGLRSTRIRQLNQAVVYMPNNVVANSAILNWSRLKKRFIDMRLGLEYETTNEQISQMITRVRKMMMEQPTIERNSVVVHIIDFTTESIQIIVRGYVYLTDWKQFTAEKERITLLILEIMKDLRIELAEAITDIRMVEEDRISRLTRKMQENSVDE